MSNVVYSYQQYDDDSVFLDGLYEFHPEFFESLSTEEREALKRYYLVGEEEIPDDVHSYVESVRRLDTSIEGKARKALERLCRIAGIKS